MTTGAACAVILDKQLRICRGHRARRSPTPAAAPALMRSRNRAGSFDLEKGVLDPARAVALVTDPYHPLSFMNETGSDVPDLPGDVAASTISGSSVPPITVAADLRGYSGAALERCASKVKFFGSPPGRGRVGNRAKPGWPPQGRPNPGRLNDLRTSSYKSADAPWRLRAQESRADDARGPAQGKHRRRTLDWGAQACWPATERSARS